MNIVHITCNEGLSAVYPSQVLRPMSVVAERTGARIRLLVGSPLGEFLRRPARLAWRARHAIAEREFGLSIARMPTLPARLRGLVPEQAFASRWLRALVVPSEPVILHCRGRAAAELGLAVRAVRRSARVVFDCRGWEGPELLHSHGFASEDGAPADLMAASQRLEDSQKAAALASDAVIVVSDAMRQVALRQWSVEEDRLAVLPCCAETETQAVKGRDAMRTRLGLDGRFVVVYCGSLAHYQAIEATLDLFEAVRTLKDEALFFGITPSRDWLSSILHQRGLPEQDWRVVSAPHQEVSALIAAGDVALLMRERSKVNAVASPVKFAEYLAAGVPVVLSEGIGDYSDLVRRNGIGCVLPAPPAPAGAYAPLDPFLNTCDDSAAAIRQRCRAVAKRELSAERAARTLSNLYQALWRDVTGEEGARPVPRAQRRAA